ncbi:MAG: hypothetical protein U0326_06650 [Polyangiales bacterium]
MRAATLSALLLVCACSAEPTTFTSPDASSAPDAVADVSSDGPPRFGDVIPLDRPASDVAPLDDVLVYANTASELYRVEPRSFAITLVGRFTFSDSDRDHQMTDIAVNAAGEIWGITFNAIYRIDAATARCTLVSPLEGQYNGLTFVPVGVLNPSAEVLLAVAGSGDYYVVNTGTGRVQRLGSYGAYASSGDLVSIASAETWAIVKVLGDDNLARVDLRTGRTTLVGPTGVDDVWGLGYWRSRLYGFTQGGQFVTLDPATGRATVQSTASRAWWGAGVTTIAPVAPP